MVIHFEKILYFSRFIHRHSTQIVIFFCISSLFWFFIFWCQWICDCNLQKNIENWDLKDLQNLFNKKSLSEHIYFFFLEGYIKIESYEERYEIKNLGDPTNNFHWVFFLNEIKCSYFFRKKFSCSMIFWKILLYLTHLFLYLEE